MIFVWDEGKNRINRRKHGVSFDAAIWVFADSMPRPMSTGSSMARNGGIPSAWQAALPFCW
jgi:uncharacterized DUF497 family protein